MENQETRQNKTLSIVIAIGVILVALSVFYYLVVFLPKKEARILEQNKINEEKTLFEKRKLCKEYESRIRAYIENENKKRSLLNYAEELKTIFYSKKKDTCVYTVNGVGYIEAVGMMYRYGVYDAMTNEELNNFSHADQKKAEITNYIYDISDGEVKNPF